MRTLTVTALVLAMALSAFCLHEDQIGKFDWHQKFVGPVKFIFNDPHQVKRLIVGTEDNSIGALHGNTGNVLYRQLLENPGKLLYYGAHPDKQTVAVSIQEGNLVKIRTFIAATGIKVDEWVIQAEATHVTFSGNKAYLINGKPDAGNQISVIAFNLKTETAATQPTKYSLGPATGGLCDVTGPYFVCAKGNFVTVLNVADGSISSKKLDDAAETLELSTSGAGPISGVVFQGSGFAKVFILVENSKAGAEFLPINNISPSNTRISLSQFTNDEKPLLYISRLEDHRTVKMEAYSRNGQIVEGSKVLVKTSMPLGALKLTQGFIVNNRYAFVGIGKDELVFGTSLDGSSSSNLEIEWSREESLSSLAAVEMVDYPSDVGPTWNPYLATSNIISAFISRIKYEVEAIALGESLYASDDDRFGLRKVIVFVTKVGKVIGMDSSAGNVLYTFLLPDFSLFADFSAFLYIQRPAKYAPLKPQAAVIYKSVSSGQTILLAFDPVEGKLLDDVRKYPPALQTQMAHHAGEETKYVKPILLLDKQNNVHIYPAGAGGNEEVKNSYFFVAKKGSTPVLSGYAVENSKEQLKAIELWDLTLGVADLIGVYGKLPTERVHSQGRVLPDRSVSYKYMNPNLVVVVTSEPEAGDINLFLVDAVSGALVHSFWHKKCRGPVHVVHSEHWIVYSLFNERNRRYEINSVELYEGQAQSNSTAFSSFAAPPVEPIIVKQSYIFPTSIQHLAHTRTEKGITNKDILIALPTGGVLELPRIVVQPRVSHQHYTQQMQDEDGVIHSIPYQPELPILPEMIFNYNQSVRRVDGIRTWPTRLESTCLVLVHGSDLYYTKLTPSKTFDILKDDFDHWIISVALIGLSAAAYAAKRLAARKQLDQAWK